MHKRLSKAILPAAGGMVSAFSLLVFGVIAVGPMKGQSQPPLAFDVASIRPGDPQPQSAGLRFLPSGGMAANNWPLELLIQEVYKVGAFQIAGLEQFTSGWKTTRFNIQAKAGGPASEDQLKLMAQTLLTDRFGLKFHREKREVSVYALVPAKSGIKLRVAEDQGRPRGSGGISASVPMGRVFGNNVTMAHFVQILSEQQLDRPVVDRTNFTDPFDFNLEYAAIDRPDAIGPSIFVAVQEQLGLKLDPVKAPIEVMVIDHLEKPSEN
jgi:bla regulator protein blaR1